MHHPKPTSGRVTVEGLERRVLFAVVPAGEPFRVDPGGGTPHGVPAVSADADGDFVAVWMAEHEFGEFDVFARRYSAAGVAQGPVFQVNQTPTGMFVTPDPVQERRARPDVALDADGDFVVTWEKERPATGGGGSDVYARRFAADGASRGNEFVVNAGGASSGGSPAVSAAPDGDFMVAWVGPVDGAGDVAARRYSSDGSPLGAPFRVDTNDAPGDSLPEVSVGAGGHAVVTWSDGDRRLVARRFAPGGAPVGNELVVGTYRAGYLDGGVSVDAAGGFAAVYVTHLNPDSGFPGHIYVQRYRPDGTPLLPLVDVATVEPYYGALFGANLAGAPDGRFVVTWTQFRSTATRAMAAWYDADGTPSTPATEVSTPVDAAEVMPGVAMDARGDTVVVWRGQATPGIFARRYVENGGPVVGSLTDAPDPVLSGRAVTLTASDVRDPDGGAVDAVSFFRESNGVPGFQPPAGGGGADTFLGTVTAAPYTFVAPTTGLAAGTYTYYAVARDAGGAEGVAASTVNTVFAGPAGPPKVAQVSVDGSTWTAAFRQALASAGLGTTADGFAVPGGAGQLAPVPFGPVDRISVKFTEDVRVGPTTLSVTGAGGAAYLGATPTFAYDPGTFTATWTLARPVTADRLRLALDSSRQNGVYDFDDVALDGEWADGADAYPSGDGVAGGAFGFAVNVLQGDVNRNGRVDAQDLTQLWRRRYNPDFPNPARYSVFADVDGSGRIDVRDLVLVRNRLGRRLPANGPAALLP